MHPQVAAALLGATVVAEGVAAVDAAAICDTVVRDVLDARGAATTAITPRPRAYRAASLSRCDVLDEARGYLPEDEGLRQYDAQLRQRE